MVDHGRAVLDFHTLEDSALIEQIARAFGAPASDAPASDAPASDALLNEAVEALYDRYGRLVYSIAMRLLNDPAGAEEVTQDVFVRVCQNAHTYRADQVRLSSWLVSITRHAAIDELRRRGARPESRVLDWPEESDPLLHDPALAGDDPQSQVERRLQRRSVQQAVQALPADQRQALALAFFNGFSHQQIADTLGEPLGTVKSRIRLGMEKLRDLLSGLDPGAP
jgi:RNA polymerase sigma-70 factor (ECF subfamily)